MCVIQLDLQDSAAIFETLRELVIQRIHLPIVYCLLDTGTPHLPSPPCSPFTTEIPSIILSRSLAGSEKTEEEALT